MKKLIALLLVLTMAVALVACGEKEAEPTQKATEPATEPATEIATEPATEDATEPAAEVMTYADFMAAETDALVCVESYIQAHQAWWFDSDAGHGKVTIYLQDAEGAYFAYEVNCTEEVAAQLVPGTKVRVSGEKAEWAGEIEIMNSTLEVIEGADSYVAEAKDVTALLGSEELEAEMNKLVSFKGMTVSGISFKDSQWDPDIYVALTKDGAEYSFCVENYLSGPDTELYETVKGLTEGTVIDLEGYLYWYEGPNTHITAVTVAE